ncbi:unnamed protein product [Cunninghamella echinulata]
MTVDTSKYTETINKKGHIPVGKNREPTPVNIYYELHGNGSEKVVLVMGLSTPCQAWINQVRYFVGTGKYTVLIFDNRGMGLSDAPRGLYSTSQMAQDALELLDNLGWTSDVHIASVSMGGMISLEMATAQPHRFKSLNLTSTCAKTNIPQIKAITTLAKAAFIDRTLEDKLDGMVSLIYPPHYLDQPCKENPAYPTNRDMIKAEAVTRSYVTRLQPLHGNIGQTAACLRHRVSDDRLLSLRQTGLPILIVTGTWDHLVRPQYSYHMQKVLDAKLEVFHGSGHGLLEEQKEKYNILLDNHFTQACKQ